MSKVTQQQIEKLEEIMLGFGEAHNLLAKTSLSKEEYQPISGLLAKAKVELFNFYNAHKAALQNKVSDISAEGILDKYYKPKMHWKVVNRKNVLAAMHEYASIVNERKDNAGINDAIEFADWINKNASRNAVGSWGYFGNMFYTKTSKELYDIFKSESQPQQKEVDGYDDEMPPL